MRTLLVGDVHGCADELLTLLQRAAADRVVLVGDLFTKGPDPRGVFTLVEPHRAVLGNHDDRLLKIVDGARSRDAEGALTIEQLAGTPWEAWLRALPLTLKVDGYTVVHAGLNPTKPKKTTRAEALYLRTYPASGGLFWWQQYRAKRGVVFGHDARRGLVRVERNGKAHLIGLDTGCVYGGQLTGWLLEEDRFLQVQAKRRYCAIA